MIAELLVGGRHHLFPLRLSPMSSLPPLPRAFSWDAYPSPCSSQDRFTKNQITSSGTWFDFERVLVVTIYFKVSKSRYVVSDLVAIVFPRLLAPIL